MRLIDQDALLQDISKTIEESGCVYHESEIMDCVRYAPTIDAEPVVYAKIVPKGKGFTHWHECSKCGTAVDIGDKCYRECRAHFRKEQDNG